MSEAPAPELLALVRRQYERAERQPIPLSADLTLAGGQLAQGDIVTIRGFEMEDGAKIRFAVEASQST